MTTTARMQPPKIAKCVDPQAVSAAMRVLLAPGQVVEVRALDAVLAGNSRNHKTVSGYFDDVDKLARSVATITQARGIYWTLNPCKPELLARSVNRLQPCGSTPTTSDPDIITRRWLLVDIDAERPAGISATDAEHDEALHLARTIRDYLAGSDDDTPGGWPEPILADSGNGGHLLYHIDVPGNDEGLVQRCLTALAARFNGEKYHVDVTVFNPARICKLYGTTAGKGDPAAASIGRPHRMARLLEIPEHLGIVPVDCLKGLAATVPEAEKPATNNRAEGNGHHHDFNIERWISEHLPEAGSPRQNSGGGRKWVLKQCAWNPEHTDWSFYVIEKPNGAIAAGCNHNSCAGRQWKDLRLLLDSDYRARQEGRRYDKPGSNGKVDHVPAAAVVYERLTSAELDAGDFTQRYLVEDVLPEGQGGIVSGRFKTLKTTGAIDLGMSLGSGTTFLNKFIVPEANPVGIMSAESGLYTLQETARRVASSKGISLAGLGDRLLWSTSCPRLARLDHLDAVEKFIKTNGLRLLIIDPSYLALSDIGDSASNVFKMGGVLRPLTGIIQTTGCAIILLNHNRKGRAPDVGRFDPPDLGEISMSGFAEWARFWLLFGPRKEWDEQTGQHRLWLRIGGSAGHASLWALDVAEGKRNDVGGRRWDVTVATATDAKADEQSRRETVREQEAAAKLDRDRQSVLRAAAKYPAGESPKTIRIEAGLNPGRFDMVIPALLETGMLTTCEVYKPNRKAPYTGYRLGAI